jgi:sugar lactone lactonase YvrE
MFVPAEFFEARRMTGGLIRRVLASPVSLIAAAAAGLVFGAGCSARTTSRVAETAAPSMVWPAPPEVARVTYLRSVFRPADLGIKASAWTRFGRWLTGSDKGNEALIKPFGLSLDEEDNLCLTDTGANAVCFYDRKEQKWHRWTGVEKLRFVSPVAAVRSGGNFYVVDSGLGALICFNTAGRLVFQTTNHLARPAGIAVSKGKLFVADSQQHSVGVFDLAGNYQSGFGKRGAGPGEFNFPTHVAVDSAGNLLVTDSMNCRIQLFDSEGHFVEQVGAIGDSPGQFARPKGVAFDNQGRIYALDAVFDNLQIFDRSGKLLLNLGATGSGVGEFWLPNGIAISRSNEIFVADSYNHRLQVLKYIGPS